MAEMKANRRVVTGLRFIDGWYLGRASMRQGRRLVPMVPTRLLLPFEFAWNRAVCAIRGHDRILETVEETHKDGKFPCCMCGVFVPVQRSSND